MTKKNPKTYTADRDVYVDNHYHKAGHPFTTMLEPEEFWTKIDEKTAHIEQASLDRVPGDPPLEELSVAALQAVAVTKHINVTGMNKQQLIDAIKAWKEPAL